MRALIDFIVFDWLKADHLLARERHADHSRGVFASVLDMCERVAAEQFAPHNRLVDVEEPRLVDGRVQLPAAAATAWRAYMDTGMAMACQDADVGGMQLPYLIDRAAHAFFYLASNGLCAYPMLAVSNANLVDLHGTPRQKAVFGQMVRQGRATGTMCLSEPQAGSSLSDITTRAQLDGDGFEADPLGPRYRLRGTKMWITAGENELAGNTVHLVLAKAPDAQGRMLPGAKAISLFIVPRYLTDADGAPTGMANDVALVGLNHKLGNRGAINTLLNFGEGRHRVQGAGHTDGLDGQGAGAIGYRMGQPGQGLQLMFHMMNEMRIEVGTAAATLGLAGYAASLAYARQRPQGRPVGAQGKDPGQPQVRLIEHADIKRMLLAQKAYAEGGLALQMYCARLVDDLRTGTAQEAADAQDLLEILTPIAKSWPSEWCLEGNSHAIQIHGGYGYTRDFPVEQYWRDQRLNMIHEGAHGIHGLDLLGRKVRMQEGRALLALCGRMRRSIGLAERQPALRGHAQALEQAIVDLQQATTSAWQTQDPGEALANATPYLQAFGHVVLAWVWLELAAAAQDHGDDNLRQGKLAACRYFFHHELPKIGAWLQVVASRDPTCRDVADAWF